MATRTFDPATLARIQGLIDPTDVEEYWRFADPKFRTNLIQEFRNSAATHGVNSIDNSVFDVLLFLALVRRAPSEQLPTGFKGFHINVVEVGDAMASVRKLAEDAAQFARNRRSSRITVVDLAASYRKNYCQVWPFCG